MNMLKIFYLYIGKTHQLLESMQFLCHHQLCVCTSRKHFEDQVTELFLKQWTTQPHEIITKINSQSQLGIYLNPHADICRVDSSTIIPWSSSSLVSVARVSVLDGLVRVSPWLLPAATNISWAPGPMYVSLVHAITSDLLVSQVKVTTDPQHASCPSCNVSMIEQLHRVKWLHRKQGRER